MSQKIRIFLCDSVEEIEEQIIRTLGRIVHIGEAGTTLWSPPVKNLAERPTTKNSSSWLPGCIWITAGFGSGLVPALGLGCLGASAMDGLTWLGVC